MIEQTPAVFLANMPLLARREVGRAQFWICDGPYKIFVLCAKDYVRAARITNANRRFPYDRGPVLV